MAKSDELSRKEDSADQWIISILEERPLSSSHRELQKVPRELREKEENKGFFDPRVISIGPYHHGKPELKEAEKLKTRAVCLFIEADINVKPHEIYNKMLEVVSYVRSCYIEGSTDAYDDEALARMMLLDGCFILQFIYATKHGEGPFLDELIKHVGHAGSRAISVDITLLENQLPFLVLQTLISTSTTYPEGQWEEWIENFTVQNYIDKSAAWRRQTYKHERAEQPLHFLDLMRRRFLGFNSDSMIIPCWGWLKSGHGESNPVKDAYNYSFRSATELKARGILIRPSTTFFPNDFTFTSGIGYGLLTIPQVSFGLVFRHYVLNMMAYELAL